MTRLARGRDHALPAREEEQHHPNDHRDVRDVEDGPVAHVDEIDDVPARRAVEHVAERAGHDHREPQVVQHRRAHARPSPRDEHERQRERARREQPRPGRGHGSAVEQAERSVVVLRIAQLEEPARERHGARREPSLCRELRPVVAPHEAEHQGQDEQATESGGVRPILCLFVVVLLGCPPNTEGKGKGEGTSSSACAKVGDSCTFAPGKLGTCVSRVDCNDPGPACLVCQSQH